MAKPSSWSTAGPLCNPCGGRRCEKVLELLDEAFMNPELSLPACVAIRDEPINAHFYASRTLLAPCSRW